MRRALVAASLASLSGCGNGAVSPRTIFPYCDETGKAGVQIDGQRYETLDDPVTLKLLAARLGPANTPIHLRTDAQPDLPYRCIGGTIFLLQRMGYRRIEFIAEPPPANAR